MIRPPLADYLNLNLVSSIFFKFTFASTASFDSFVFYSVFNVYSLCSTTDSSQNLLILDILDRYPPVFVYF